MSDNFDVLFERLIGREGRYSNDPRDAGGETNWGISRSVAREHDYAGAMAAMTREQAKAIYRSNYWVNPGIWRVESLSPKLAEELFDTGVNMGATVAGLFLQRSLNALNEGGRDYPDLTVDGLIGPSTMSALTAFLKKRGKAGEAVLLKAMNCLQGARYLELAESRAADEAFVFGWLANRVSLAA